MTGWIVAAVLSLTNSALPPGGASVSAYATSEVGDDCEAATIEAMDSTDSVPDQLLALEQLAPTCAGTGVFEAGLAYTYIYAGRPGDAERLVENALAQETGYGRELRGVLGDALFRQERFDEAESTARALIADHPDFFIGYTRLGDVLLVTGDYAGVVSAIETANALQETSDAYLLLTMAHFNLGNYQQSAQALQRSLELDIDGLRHTSAVATGALSLLALGHYDAGRQLLEKHVELVPEAVNAAVYEFALEHYQRAAEERQEAPTPLDPQ